MMDFFNPKTKNHQKMKALRSYLVIAIMLYVPATIKAQDREGIPEINFRKSQQILGDSRVFGIAIADVDMDGDNDLDIVLGKREDTGGNPIYFNESVNNQFSKKPYLGQTPPGMTPEKFAPDIVSSSWLREYSLTLSSDSTEVYFYRFGENVPSKLYVSRFENDSWTEPAEFEPSSGHPASEPCMTPDNHRLYFMWEKGETVFPEYYMVERNRTGWSDPVHAGQGMYLTSSIDGQLYTTDISALMTTGQTYLAKVSTNQGVFTRLTRIQVQPNYGTQAHPCIAPDSSYLLFDIDSGNHLFVSFRKSDGTWNRGIDLVNHGFDIKAGGAYISPDGKYLFFSLNGDIWWVDIKVIENLNPFTGGIFGDISPGFELYQNIPNPCQTYTRIAFSLEKPGNITLDLYSNLGTRISRLICNQYLYSGKHELGFDISNLRPGIYTYALTIGSGQTLTKKMVVT
jgi:hypothetical protein